MKKVVLKCTECGFKHIYEVEQDDARTFCENCFELFEISDGKDFTKNDLEEIKNADWEKHNV